MEKIKHLGIRITPEMHQKLRIAAAKQNLTLRDLITYIVNEYLKKVDAQ